jgi:hypothetical protein
LLRPPWTNAAKQTLLNKISGKSTTQAQTILKSYPGVSSAKITLSTNETTLPSDINQITLDIKPITGLSDGTQ